MFRRLDHRAGHYALLLLVTAALCLPNLGGPTLWDIDEGHNAEAAREMLVSGNWVVPTFNFQLRSDKPALLYWLQIAAYRWFSVDEFAARLPSAIAALATVLATYELGRRLFDPSTALLAGVVLATSVMFCGAAHFANPDAVLLLCTTLTLFFFWGSYARGSRTWFVPAGISAGFAVLAKGPVGLLLPSAVTIVFLLWSRRLRVLWDRRLPLGVLAFLLVALPWYIWVTAETKSVFPREFFHTHNAGRYLAPMEGHGGSVFYYPVCLLIGLMPWSAWLGLVIWSALGRRAREDDVNSGPNDTTPARRVSDGRPSLTRRASVPLSPKTSMPLPRPARGLPAGYRFLWCWIATYLVFFSLSATKLPNYVLPICPPLAILTGRFLDRWHRGSLAVPAWMIRACFTCMIAIGVAFGVGLLAASGLVSTRLMRGHTLPGVERFAILGPVSVFGVLVAWYYWRRGERSAVVATMAVTSFVWLMPLAAWGGAALNACKSAQPLVEQAHVRHLDREIRVGWYGYYEPSVVFYCGREVAKLMQEADAVEFLRYPVPVYLFVPARVWLELEPKVHGPCEVIGRHRDFYKADDILVVTNQPTSLSASSTAADGQRAVHRVDDQHLSGPVGQPDHIADQGKIGLPEKLRCQNQVAREEEAGTYSERRQRRQLHSQARGETRGAGQQEGVWKSRPTQRYRLGTGKDDRRPPGDADQQPNDQRSPARRRIRQGMVVAELPAGGHVRDMTQTKGRNAAQHRLGDRQQVGQEEIADEAEGHPNGQPQTERGRRRPLSEPPPAPARCDQCERRTHARPGRHPARAGFMDAAKQKAAEKKTGPDQPQTDQQTAFAGRFGTSKHRSSSLMGLPQSMHLGMKTPIAKSPAASDSYTECSEAFPMVMSGS
jgi:4-amino-4-deoxy-L-arabinose transferase-like glycosyltransferase